MCGHPSPVKFWTVASDGAKICRKRGSLEKCQICFPQIAIPKVKKCQRGPTAGPRIITVICVIMIELPCVPKIPDMSGNNMAFLEFDQMLVMTFFFFGEHLYFGNISLVKPWLAE